MECEKYDPQLGEKMHQDCGEEIRNGQIFMIVKVRTVEIWVEACAAIHN